VEHGVQQRAGVAVGQHESKEWKTVNHCESL
jgi:hypothetical protein